MTLPTITALPTPPSRATDTPTEFADNADALLGALPTFRTELNAWGAALIVEASAANYDATSATSLAIGTGSKSFTVQTGKMYVTGTFVLAASASAPSTKWMFGSVDSYNIATGALVVTVLRTSGSGTYADWVISLSGPQGQGGDVLPSLSGNAGKVLQVNSGETASEWVDDGWEVIGTVNPSGAANTAFISIGTAYEELYCSFSFTMTSGGLNLELSPNGSSYSTPTLYGSGMTAPKGSLFIPSYKRDFGQFGMAVLSTGSSPFVNTSPFGGVNYFKCTGGIQALRFSAQTGNISGTATLYGRR